ncbi:MAG: AMP-binding protein, partial [Polyangiaceae bacterium]
MIDFEAHLPSDGEIRANVDAGLWRNRPLVLEVRERAASSPDREAIVDVNGRLTYGELGALVDRAIGRLRALGIERGTRVAVQIPNWRHFAVLHLALDALAAVIVPIPLIYRASELGTILSLTEADMVVIAAEHRGFSFTKMIDEVRTSLPALR